MKPSTKYAFGICGGLAIIAVVMALLVLPGQNRLRQKSPKAQAVSSAVQAALRYAITDRQELPATLSEDGIRNEIPAFYKGDIDIQSLIYLPPADRRIESLRPDTVLVIAPYADGALIGYAAGNVEFTRTLRNIILNEK